MKTLKLVLLGHTMARTKQNPNAQRISLSPLPQHDQAARDIHLNATPAA